MTYRDNKDPEIRIAKLQNEIEELKKQINELKKTHKDTERTFIACYEDVITKLELEEDKISLSLKLWKGTLHWLLPIDKAKKLSVGAKVRFHLHIIEEN